MEKTTVFNLIILDESGSMTSLAKQTVDGCNETLNVVRSLEQKHGDIQRNLVSIYLFQSGSVPSRYVYKNQPIANVKDMTMDIYCPCGCTPLLDAVGSTLVDLRAVASTHEDATGTVTIITDGMENSSREYTYEMVSKIISEMKEQGWTINFIGANIDVDAVSHRMNIDNAMAFVANGAGAKQMWGEFSRHMFDHHASRIEAEQACETREERLNTRKRISKKFFGK
ncbi:MAG: hypothetical protein HDR88_12500 [Bacteroides sp.]|nr:hypothetical protein [Bacteroides sp.]